MISPNNFCTHRYLEKIFGGGGPNPNLAQGTNMARAGSGPWRFQVLIPLPPTRINKSSPRRRFHLSLRHVSSGAPQSALHLHLHSQATTGRGGEEEEGGRRGDKEQAWPGVPEGGPAGSSPHAVHTLRDLPGGRQVGLHDNCPEATDAMLTPLLPSVLLFGVVQSGSLHPWHHARRLQRPVSDQADGHQHQTHTGSSGQGFKSTHDWLCQRCQIAHVR